MRRKNPEIEITSLGDAVNHVHAVYLYFNQHHKIMTRFFITTTLTGLMLGLYYLSTIKTVNVKELTPIGMTASNPFVAVAQGTKEVVKIDSSGNIFLHGKPIGTVDKNFTIVKFRDRNEMLIIDHRSGRAFTMDIPSLK